MNKVKNSIIGSSIAFVLASSCCWLPTLLIAFGGGSVWVNINNGLERFSGLFFTAGISFLAFGIYYFKKPNKMIDDKQVILKSTLSCPTCGYQKEETMPTNACQFFYECENCKTVLKPKPKDCCVYCSYGTVPCPPVQKYQPCC